jgi:hypothetical protein
MALSFKGSYGKAPVSFPLQIVTFFFLVEPHTAAFSDERSERHEHLLAAETTAGGETAGREEPANFDD